MRLSRSLIKSIAGGVYGTGGLLQGSDVLLQVICFLTKRRHVWQTLLAVANLGTKAGEGNIQLSKRLSEFRVAIGKLARIELNLQLAVLLDVLAKLRDRRPVLTLKLRHGQSAKGRFEPCGGLPGGGPLPGALARLPRALLELALRRNAVLGIYP